MYILLCVHLSVEVRLFTFLVLHLTPFRACCWDIHQRVFWSAVSGSSPRLEFSLFAPGVAPPRRTYQGLEPAAKL